MSSLPSKASPPPGLPLRSAAAPGRGHHHHHQSRNPLSFRRPRSVVIDVATPPRVEAIPRGSSFALPPGGDALRGALEATLRRWLDLHHKDANDAAADGLSKDDSLEDDLPLPSASDPLKAALNTMMLAVANNTNNTNLRTTTTTDAAAAAIEAAAAAIFAIVAQPPSLPPPVPSQNQPSSSSSSSSATEAHLLLRSLLGELCRTFMNPALPTIANTNNGAANANEQQLVQAGASRHVTAASTVRNAVNNSTSNLPIVASPSLWRAPSTGRLRYYLPSNNNNNNPRNETPIAATDGSPYAALLPQGFAQFKEDPSGTAMLSAAPSPTFGTLHQTPAWVESPGLPPCADPGGSQTSIMSLMVAAPPQHTRVAAVGQELDDGTVDVNQYVLLQQLGRGRQGEVFLAMDTERNVLRAMKVVRRPRVKPPSQATAVEGSGTTAASFTQGSPLSAARDRARQQLEREITIMKTCRHRNVVALYEVIDDPDHAVMYIAMQYVEHGPLASLDPGTGAVDKTVAPRLLAHYARQLCAGLQYLHKHGVIHRDIKPENILLGQDDQVYLADFGMADVFDDAAANTAETAGSPHAVRGTRGTIAFMAPELVDATASTSATGEAVDVWALGVTLYALLYGTLPWNLGREEGGGGRLDVMEQITRKVIDFPETAGSGGVDGQRRPASSSVDSGTGIGGDEDYLTAVATDVSVNDSPSSALAEADGHRLPVAHSSVLSTGWPRLLKGMLHRDPSKRLGLGAIRRRVIEIERAFDQHVGPRSDSLVTTNNGASAISLLRHRSGRGFGNATPAEPLNQHQ